MKRSEAVWQLLGIAALLVGHSLSLWATSPFGYEWIRENQSYWKVGVARDGIFALTYNDLQQAGFLPLAGPPENIQLFHHGQECALMVEGLADGSFDPGDRLLFYGQKNRGDLDTILYRVPRPHDQYALYTDTSYYFLTLGQSTGKRLGNAAANPQTTLNTYLNRSQLVLSSQYHLGNFYSDRLRFSQYDTGEGWTGPALRENQPVLYRIAGIGAYRTASLPQLNMVLVGRNGLPHQVQIRVGSSKNNLRTLGTYAFEAYQILRINESLLASDVSTSGDVYVEVTTLGSPDRVSVSLIQMTSSRDFIFTADTTYHLQLTPLNQDSEASIALDAPGFHCWDISNMEQVRRVNYSGSQPNFRLQLPASDDTRHLILQAEPYTSGITISKVNLPLSLTQPGNYLIITHPSLRKPGGEYGDPIQAYADYRASEAGGGWQPTILHIRDIFNVFGFGEPGPAGVYRFMQYLISKGGVEHVFIIGNGLQPYHNYYRRDPGEFTFPNLVPTLGHPGSDWSYSIDSSTDRLFGVIPTGRLTATNPEQVASYLNKVKEMESLPYDALFRKRIIHLSGGIEEWELNRFYGYMNEFKAVAEDHYFGAQVTTFRKTKVEPVSFFNLEKEINAGVNLVTFYGHSGPNTIDIDIGYISNHSNYQNESKYPFFLINGCNAGNIYNHGLTFGEDWMLAADRGALGFIAHTGFGLASTLKQYSQIFYEVAYGDSLFIHKSIGEIMTEATRRYQERSALNVQNITQMQQMALQGDPATPLFGLNLPDYALSPYSSAQVFQDDVDNESNILVANLIVSNFGATRTDSLRMAVRRISPEGAYDTEYLKIPSVKFQDTLRLTLPLPREGYGRNQLEIILDPEEHFTELTRENNSIRLEFFYPSSRPELLMPWNYAMVSETQLDLIATAGNVLTNPRTFQVQLDTSASFNAGSRLEKEITTDTYVSWPVDVSRWSPDDSTVFYWRARFVNPGPTEDSAWQQSSFTWIDEGSPGWMQRSNVQFNENGKEALHIDAASATWKFTQLQRRIFIENTYDYRDVELQVDGLSYIFPGRYCRRNALNALAIDKETLRPYAVLPFIFQDRRTCGREPQAINNFSLTSLIDPSNTDWNDYIQNLPPGDFVLLFSLGRHRIGDWTAANHALFAEIGFQVEQLDTLDQDAPFILLGRKGDPVGSARVILPDYDSETPIIEQRLVLDTLITGGETAGVLSSAPIGPAREWHSASYSQLLSAIEPSDKEEVMLYGIDHDGQRHPLFQLQAHANMDISSIQPNEYPYLQLQASVSDSVQLTPVPLMQWYVTYDPVPEGIAYLAQPDEWIDLPKYYQQAQPVEITTVFKNISPVSFTDSLMHEALVFNDFGEEMHQHLPSGALAAGDSVLLPFRIKGTSAGREFSILVQSNSLEIPEIDYRNNNLLLSKSIDIEADLTPPYIEVLADNAYLIDFAEVRPSPRLEIKLFDPGSFYFKSDTLGIDLFLVHESGDTLDTYFSSSHIEWEAATFSQPFTIQMQFMELPAGEYELQVNAADAAGNWAGTAPYAIRFVVPAEGGIKTGGIYPTPVSGSARGYLEIQGDEVPQHVDMRLYDMTGREVLTSRITHASMIRSGNMIYWSLDKQMSELNRGLYLYEIRPVGLPNNFAGPLVITGKVQVVK